MSYVGFEQLIYRSEACGTFLISAGTFHRPEKL